MDSVCASVTDAGQRVAVPGGELRSWAIGAGSPVLCLHGGPGGTHEYLASGLSPLRTDFRWIFFDQRRPSVASGATGPSFDDGLRDIEQIRAAHGLERYAVLGHSWGATLAVAHALATDSACQALILVNAVPLDNDWSVSMFEFLERRLRRPEVLQRLDDVTAAARPQAPPGRERILRHAEQAIPLMVRAAHWRSLPFIDVDYAWQHSVWQGAVAYIRERARPLGVPILCIQGDDDVASAGEVAESLKGLGLVSTKTLPDCGHVAPVEAGAELCAQVRALLRS